MMRIETAVKLIYDTPLRSVPITDDFGAVWNSDRTPRRGPRVTACSWIAAVGPALSQRCRFFVRYVRYAENGSVGGHGGKARASCYSYAHAIACHFQAEADNLTFDFPWKVCSATWPRLFMAASAVYC